jgi:vacuolar protein sorting-associated protein 45
MFLDFVGQALVHELLGLHNHRVDLSGVQNVQKEFREVVLSPEADHFFKGVMYQNWGDVASQIHELITQYARQNKDNRKMQTFGTLSFHQFLLSVCSHVNRFGHFFSEEMKDFVENYPQFKQLQTNACKHMTVATELHKKIDQRHLLEVWNCLRSFPHSTLQYQCMTGVRAGTRIGMRGQSLKLG